MTIPRPSPVVLALPAFTDNYVWLVHDGTHAVVVDPGDAAPVRAALERHGLTLTAILLTHHHADHVGGVSALTAAYGCPVYGPRAEAIAGTTAPLAEGDTVDLAQPALRLRVLEVPGHTRGHIAYLGESAPPWLFCGDTLFAAGCGRLFEGTPAQMQASLARLAGLPEDTLVFCAHEYTLSNLRFAVAAEPDNPDLPGRLEDARAARAAGQPTLPSTIGLERRTNPFLRADQPGVRRTLEAAGLAEPGASAVAAFAALRSWKDRF
ncbi:MAG TPA: hydroxyacylglutathione hydrolase [Telluria sp.]|nr:hydroxyacylglutathione hydrolase [Telluria sp.]